MYNNMLGQDLIDEIGEYLGFEMWNKRDTTKEYDFPNAREGIHCFQGDAFVEGNIIIFNKIPLLVYKNAGCFHAFKSLYTLNLITMKPTKASIHQTVLSQELFEKIKMIFFKTFWIVTVDVKKNTFLTSNISKAFKTV